MSPQNFLKKIIEKYKEDIPAIIKNKCIKCGECASEDVCIEKEIYFEPNKYPKIDLNKCNLCYRCIEICTYNAIIHSQAKLKSFVIKPKKNSK